MAYYKIVLNDRVIDVVNELVYARYSPKHDKLFICEFADSQGVLSENGNDAYHICTCPNEFPSCEREFFDVQVEEITLSEYEHYKSMNCMTAEEIIDRYTLQLIEGGIL